MHESRSLAQTEHFEHARSGKRLTHIALAIPLFFAFLFFIPLLVYIPMLVLFPGMLTLSGESTGTALESGIGFTLLLIGSFLPSILAVWAWVRFWEQRSFGSLGLTLRKALPRYLLGVGLGVLLYATALGISGAFGYIAPEQGDPSQQGMAALAGVLLVYLGWTIQGPTEEILCRGWLLQAIGARYRPWVGIVVSSLVFTAAHGLSNAIGPVALINLFLFGVFTCLYTIYEGGLWGVCGLHAAWNWAQGNLFGIEVSGNQAAGGTLLNYQETGPDLLTGGAFGTEGGLACTVVLGVAIMVVAMLLWRRNR